MSKPYSRLGGVVLLSITMLTLALLILRHNRRPVGAAQIIPAELQGRELPPTAQAPKLPAWRAAHPKASVEMCGFGSVPLPAHDQAATARFLKQATQRTWDHWLAVLLASADFRARAAGLLIQGKIAKDGEVTPIEDQARDALVQLAADAGDPATYAMAVYACQTASGHSSTGMCPEVTLEAWTQMDPDNAVPWLMLAERERTDQHPMAEAGAFARAVAAQRLDAYNSAPIEFSEPAIPNDATPLERWYVTTKVEAIQSVTASLESEMASEQCATAAVEEDAARAQCSALAQLFVTQGKTLIDFATGATIGARAGWSESRISELTDQRIALLQATLQTTAPIDGNPWGCDGVERGNDFTAQWVHLGQLGAARDALDRSGKTVRALAQEQRDYIDSLRSTVRQ